MSLSPSLTLTFLLLLLAHLLGDFVLQPGTWVRQKSRSGLRARSFWWHILLHGSLSWLFIGRLNFWPWAIAIILLHGLTDQLKYIKERSAANKTAAYKRRWFWWDQLLHLITLIIIAILWQATQMPAPDALRRLLTSVKESAASWWQPDHILLITMAVFLTSPSAIIIRMLITRWTPAYNTQLETDSLKNAGTYIGMLERLFVFTFIVCGQFEAVGFLLAAKSIFRFGDLKAARDRKLTEYVLIGTLLSFGLAVIAALIYLHRNLAGAL